MDKANSFGIWEVAGIGLIMLLLSFGGIAADYLLGLKLDMDGLLLLAVCLMMVPIFLIMLYFLARQFGWIGGHKSDDSAPAGQK